MAESEQEGTEEEKNRLQLIESFRAMGYRYPEDTAANWSETLIAFSRKAGILQPSISSSSDRDELAYNTTYKHELTLGLQGTNITFLASQESRSARWVFRDQSTRIKSGRLGIGLEPITGKVEHRN